jgi:hypothetical protein
MDSDYTLMIPSLQLASGLEKRQNSITWSGREYPQEPVRYCWQEHSVFRQFEVKPTPWLQSLIPTALSAELPDWMGLQVASEALDIIWNDAAQGEASRIPLFQIIEETLRAQPKWIVFYPVDEDRLEFVGAGTISDVIDRTKQRIGWYTQKSGDYTERSGFLIWQE